MTTSLLWLRRDLRRHDHPALAAAADGGGVLAVYVLDPDHLAAAGPGRLAWLAATLHATAESFGERLCVRLGDPAEVIPALARELDATAVHATAETEPACRMRDDRVAQALAGMGIDWLVTGSPYAVTPGRVRTLAGRGYRVFTPFEKAWRARGWRDPAVTPDSLDGPTPRQWIQPEAAALLNSWLTDCPIGLPPAGEAAARQAWREFRDERLDSYAEDRDRADLPSGSRLSAYLALGVLHPRTLLADLAGRSDPGATKFVSELAWREFYADVLWHHPDSLAGDLVETLTGMTFDEPDARYHAWQAGRTGYPLVDAGMRQLLAEGWLPNRVRMVAASFLLKDLHLPWHLGARHFREHLIDYDTASNTHNWQWVAGTGTDAAPYHRIFNPVSQAAAADPDGAYVRRHLPELAHLPGPAALRPWDHPDGHRHGYPVRILDHAAERAEALTRYRLAVGG
ncbi:MAG: deoxyribodipyrimidine photo-lyase [Propionicimonas sp.]|uniref:cryptochrome/photolyase family protein n=1 Tax=Propionicimonas sp. TaxID=1955623 RepID=UPI002B201D64|nr:deoxyribodipyrimidine photo-lyase [Propionicimonas sp.]MEA4944021.1 deoxyribodipyrimidine photo-lyase [Propionicimonas sp.]